MILNQPRHTATDIPVALLKLLFQLAQRGTTLFVISHTLPELTQNCDRVANVTVGGAIHA